MRFNIKIVRDWIPPIIFKKLRNMMGKGVHFIGNYSLWKEAEECCSGYSHSHILDKVLDATLKVKNGDAVFERDSVIFDENHYSWPVVAGLMWSVARYGGKLNVLDFGGSLGSSYFQNQNFIYSLSDVQWGIVEQPHYVKVGQDNIQDDRLKFYENIDTFMKDNRPNVVLLSSVLQYLEKPFDLIEKLSSFKSCSLIIDKTAFSDYTRDRLTIQIVPPSIYDASYPMWIFDKHNFLKRLSSHWKIISEHDNSEGRVETDDGFGFSFSGMILESKC